jgi:Ribonuclease G/E
VAETLIRVSVSPGEHRIALLRDGALGEVFIERPARPDGVGDLHRARVSAISAPMAGAFLTLADGSTAFLPESEASATRQPIARALTEGQPLAVRMVRAAQGGKGPRVSARLTPAEQATVEAAPATAGLIAHGPGAAFRLARAHPDAAIITDGPSLALALRGAFGRDRVRLGAAFDDELEDAFAALAEPIVPLPGGGRLTIQPTAALVAIDVDAGSHAGGRDASELLRLNEAALAVATREIRLRNLGGAILLDVAGLSVKARAGLEPKLARALAEDPLHPRLLGLTRGGLFEIQRPRLHPPLHEILGGSLTPGLAALRRATREAAATPGRRWALRAAPEVLRALGSLPGALAEAEAAIGTPLTLVPDPTLRPGAEVVEHAA